MSRRPSDRSSSPLSLLSFSLTMLGVLVVLLLAACATDDRRPPAEVAQTDGQTTTPPAEPPPNASDPFAGVEEHVVTGTSTATLLTEGQTSAVAFDADSLGGLAAEDVSGAGNANPKLGKLRRRASASDVARYAPNLIVAPDPIDWNTERYDEAAEAGFLRPQDAPLSTFSVDVDTAAYANVRRFLKEQTRPPAGAVRIEELVNYFRYPHRVSSDRAVSDPFGVDLEIFDAPWAPEHHVVRIAVEGREMKQEAVPPRNLVFLLDVSGSMQGADRLGLVKYGMSRLVESLRPIDRVSIVVYAGASGLVLPPTPGDQEEKIVGALERLTAGGSTAGAAGIELAYASARKHFDPEGINRVILATDGDFNVGVTNRSDLIERIEKERESGVELTVLGVGRGNLNDAAMEQLADHGNGNYAYIDGRAEARKVLVEQANATLITIAKDVKIQVEFNPNRVAAYRLIGYENRRLADADFNDDTKDAGEIGAGHHVTALYEIVPVGARGDVPGGSIDPLKYQRPKDLTEVAASGEWLTVKLRYKDPGEDESQALSAVLAGQPGEVAQASESARFSSAVALFGMLLRDSEWKGDGDYRLVSRLAEDALGPDTHGERKEFLELVDLARRL